MTDQTLKFAKSVPYIPDPVRSKPLITDEQRALAAQEPPVVVPFHCKPWVDGQTMGWTLFYGYLTPVTIRLGDNGRIAVENGAQLAAETGQPRIIDQFAQGHFGIGSGYTLQTPPGFVSLLLPATQPPPGLHALTGVIETDWYPRQLFLVFQTPAPGVAIFLDRGMALARVVVVPRGDGWQLRPFTPAELADVQAREAAYIAEEQSTPSRWQDASGATFTHLYKQWSRQQQQE